MRNYKRQGPRPWRDKDKRMAAAVRLRAQGKSLREIGAALRVSYETIRGDLARWDAKQASTPSNIVQLSRKVSNPAVKSDPATGRDLTPEFDTPALNDRRK